MSPPRFPATLAVRRALVATCDRGPGDPGLLPDAAIAVDDRLIGWIGPDAELEEHADLSEARQIDARGRLVTPGLVDAHTHLLFGDAGGPALDFAARCAGRPDRPGGGDEAIAAATRGATGEALLAAALDRTRRLLTHGATTVEVKSGLGVSVAEELRLLRTIHELARAAWGEVTVVPTLHLARPLPPDAPGGREASVRAVAEELVPAAAAERIAACCDVAVGDGAFSAPEARRILEAARAHGLLPRLHADRLAPGGGAELAAELGCASADHLEHVSPAGVEALARAGTAAVLLPLSTLAQRGRRYAPGRSLLDAGAPVALASDVDPAGAVSENASLVLSLACLELGLTPAEALVAYTAGGARALRLSDAGRLAPGLEADLVVWGCRSVEHLAWHAGVSHALMVVKRGRPVHQAQAWTAADCAAA